MLKENSECTREWLEVHGCVMVVRHHYSDLIRNHHRNTFWHDHVGASGATLNVGSIGPELEFQTA